MLCAFCQMPAEKELYTLTHRYAGEKKVDAVLNFCSWECLETHLWDEKIRDKVNQEIEKEVKWLQKQVCPACVRRIT